MKRVTSVLLVALAGAVTSPLPAATYYVSSTGDDTNQGLGEASSWRTIAAVNE